MKTFDDIVQLEICPARTIYQAERFGTSVWHIRECYWIYKELMYEDDDREAQIQAWCYVKAYTKILKEKKAWDYEHGAPFPDPEWKSLAPNTTEWIAHYMSHPKDQGDMHAYKRNWELERRRHNANKTKTG